MVFEIQCFDWSKKWRSDQDVKFNKGKIISWCLPMDWWIWPGALFSDTKMDHAVFISNTLYYRTFSIG